MDFINNTKWPCYSTDIKVETQKSKSRYTFPIINGPSFYYWCIHITTLYRRIIVLVMKWKY